MNKTPEPLDFKELHLNKTTMQRTVSFLEQRSQSLLSRIDLSTQPRSTNRLGRTPNEGNLPLPTHENLDTIVDNCRRGRTTKTAATKDLLESVERLTHLPAQTREEAFVSYIAKISSID